MCGISAAKAISKILEMQDEILNKIQNLESAKETLEDRKGARDKCDIEVSLTPPSSFHPRRMAISEEALILAVEFDLSELSAKYKEIESDIVNMSKQITQG